MPCLMKKLKPQQWSCYHLILIQGAYVALQSYNGQEFAAKIIGYLLKVWKDCKIAQGSPRHAQSQRSMERANADLKDNDDIHHPNTYSVGHH